MTWNNIQGEIGLKIARIQEHQGENTDKAVLNDINGNERCKN